MEPPNSELLFKEYQECNSGYAYRDQLTNECCRGIIQTFSVFLTILLATTVFIEVDRGIHIVFCIVIGIASLFSMGTLLLDLESTTSSKVALRSRSVEIESKLKSVGGPKVWDIIDNRKKFFEEGLFKGHSDSEKGRAKDRREPEYDLLIWSTRILVLLWIIILIIIVIWGPTMRLAMTTP